MPFYFPSHRRKRNRLLLLLLLLLLLRSSFLFTSFFNCFCWAMSETMSSPSDWLQFYNQNVSTHTTSSSGAQVDNRVSDATVVTTTVTSSTAVNSSSNTGHLSPDGRVSKPVRRRSRASRRTPTTLLNTDTTNFRAMVQQFTGGPGAPFAHPCGPSFGFGLGAGRQAQVNNPTAMMLPPGHGYHHLQQQQQQLYQQQGPQYMFSLSSNNNNNAAGEAFLQRLGASRAAGLGPGSDGFVMDGVSSSSGQVGPARPSGSGNENRSNSFIF